MGGQNTIQLLAMTGSLSIATRQVLLQCRLLLSALTSATTSLIGTHFAYGFWAMCAQRLGWSSHCHTHAE
jgi:hypothetical protein